MADPAKVLELALTLTEREREDLALALLESVPAPADELADDRLEFADEIQRRVEEVRAGRTDGVDWEDLRATIARKHR